MNAEVDTARDGRPHRTARGFDFGGSSVFRNNTSCNIVIRNPTIHHVDTGERDGITVQKNSTNVWVDYNEFYKTSSTP
ncbi:hypothetical protein [Saccharothrix sp.]|uniref:pectate lyase family protein n=1 Tax=Saccharothrix sp. TaxID=1873460 RepID=UPI002811ECCF|nr:hypothetical protein [Saccharothrix sp.]